MADGEPNIVDVNTDNLDDFNALLHGKAIVKEEEAAPKDEDKEEEVEPEEESSEETPNNTDLDEGGEEEGEEQAEPKEKEKPVKKGNTFQDRINELTARAREAERREAEALRRIQEAEEAKSKTAAPLTPVKEQSEPTPDAKNEDGSDKYPLGEFDPSYIRDLTRHTINVEQAAANERATSEKVKAEETQAREFLQTQWATKLSTVTEKHEDFLEKTLQLESAFDGLDPKYSDYLVQTIKSLDNGPEVLYHFANNLDEAQKFVKLGPLAATLALGELNAKFKAETKTEPKATSKVTNAPPPPQVNKGTKTRTAVAADTDDLDAFSKLLFSKKRR